MGERELVAAFDCPFFEEEMGGGMSGEYVGGGGRWCIVRRDR